MEISLRIGACTDGRETALYACNGFVDWFRHRIGQNRTDLLIAAWLVCFIPMRDSMAINEVYDIYIIGGCGHVGLALGLAFADRGKRVILYDKNENAVHAITAKRMPFL